MKTARKDLVTVIGERTMHISDSTELAREVAAYMVADNQRVNLDSLMRDIMQYRLEHGIVEATVVSAFELSPQVLTDVDGLLREHFPEAKSVTLNCKVDDTVVGGVRIELPRERLDLTVQARLNTFKRLTSPERN